MWRCSLKILYEGLVWKGYCAEKVGGGRMVYGVGCMVYSEVYGAW